MTLPSLSTLLTILLTMPSCFFFEATTRAIQYGRRIACIITIRALAWVQAMAVRIVLESRSNRWSGCAGLQSSGLPGVFSFVSFWQF